MNLQVEMIQNKIDSLMFSSVSGSQRYHHKLQGYQAVSHDQRT